MSLSHISHSNTAGPQRQGAVIQSVAGPSNHRMHFGVQSATFIRTVSPGQPSGSYRLPHMVPTWRGPQFTANPGPSASTFHPPAANRSDVINYIPMGSSNRVSAGSPPVPFPPRNASAFYSQAHTRIIPSGNFRAFG